MQSPFPYCRRNRPGEFNHDPNGFAQGPPASLLLSGRSAGNVWAGNRHAGRQFPQRRDDLEWVWFERLGSRCCSRWRSRDRPSAMSCLCFMRTRTTITCTTHRWCKALEHGFASVEADVFLVGDKLCVAHEADKITPEKTLQSLYLEPLRQRVKENRGQVYRKRLQVPPSDRRQDQGRADLPETSRNPGGVPGDAHHVRRARAEGQGRHGHRLGEPAPGVDAVAAGSVRRLRWPPDRSRFRSPRRS